MLKAIIKKKQDREKEAIKVLTQSIDLASEGNILFPFLEQADELLEMLKQVSPTVRNKKFLSNLFNIIEKKKLYDLPNENKKSIDLHEKIENHEQLLSKRELEILTLVGKGMRNNEIAEKLFISLDTTKKHLYHIFKKLKVHSRVAAIHQAKKLNLLLENNN